MQITSCEKKKKKELKYNGQKNGKSNPSDSKTAGNQDEELTNPLLSFMGANEVSPVTEPAQATPGKEIPVSVALGLSELTEDEGAVKCPQRTCTALDSL